MRSPPLAPGPGLLLVGGVDFDAPPVAAPRKVSGVGELATAQEVAGLARVRGAAVPRSLRGAEATEHAFREQAPASRYLHLATHGFFATPEVKAAGNGDADGRLGEKLFGGADTVVGFHRALLSGIALAGANRGAPDDIRAATDETRDEPGGKTVERADDARSLRASPRLWAAWVLSGDPGELAKIGKAAENVVADATEPSRVTGASWLVAGTAAGLTLVMLLVAYARRRRGA